jgi:serine/threonine protein phosphatase PrpC
MTDFMLTKKFVSNVSMAVEDMCKGQDNIRNGSSIDIETGELFEWIMLNDGHGTNTCIYFIRSITNEKLSELMGKSDPIKAIAEHIDKSTIIRTYESSGATAVIVKIYSDRAECINCGDSQFIVFKDDAINFISAPHNSSNESEKKRILDMGLQFVPCRNIKVISEHVMTTVPTEYVLFKDLNKLACSQALGHNSKTGYAPDKHIVKFEEKSKYRIIMGSDGLFDMLMLDNDSDLEKLNTKSAKEISDWIVGRWLYDWEGHYLDGDKTKFKYEKHETDDVSVSVIDIQSA